MKKLLFFLIPIFIGCTTQTFVNKSGSCKLRLHKSSTYYYKYPFFFGKIRERGTYTIEKDAILLTRITKNRYENNEWSSGYYYNYPDSVEFSFFDLNDSSINVSFTMNQQSIRYQTNTSGSIKFFYSELTNNKVISKDSAFYGFNISFNNKNYFIKDTFLKPTSILFQLNQYMGEKSVTLYRRFEYKNDTIEVNGVDPKAIGSDRKLVRKGTR